jgi:hypothetical protein
MNKSPTLNSYLAVLFVFLSGANTSAQQSQIDSTRPSGLAVEITGSGLSTFTLPVYQDGTFETTWSGGVPRTQWRPADNDHKGLSIPIKILKDGDAVRVDVRVGLESFKEVAVATYFIHADERVVIREVIPYGFLPFALKVIRTKIRPPIVIPPLPNLPEVENNLKSLVVVGLEKGESADEFVLSLQNVATKNIIALEVVMPTGGTLQQRGGSDKPLIGSGAIYKTNISAQTVGRITDGKFEPDPVQPRGVIKAVLFDDGTYEGDYGSAATMEARRRGRKIQLEKVIALLEKAIRSESQESATTLATVKEEIYLLSIDGDAATVEEISSRYSPLDDQLESVAQGIKDEMAARKYELINRLKSYEEGEHSADSHDLRAWLKRTKEYYESLLNAH